VDGKSTQEQFDNIPQDERTGAMIKVKNKEEAWQEANRLFPTDYEQDAQATLNAGYPIYYSAAEGNTSWISDLGDRLELNIVTKKKGVESISIWIIPEPDITVEVKWSSSDIRDMCINNNWYTAGDIRAYSKMLEYVEKSEPTKLNIYNVAKDILEHSDDPELYVEAIMFEIGNKVVKTFYEVH
jgi:hypothetical protein